MGIALLTLDTVLGALLEPLQGWVRRLGVGRRTTAATNGDLPIGNGRQIAPAVPNQRAGSRWPAKSAHAKARPLRVVRVVDAAHSPASAGRMVISGRMADVCAELDRLAALEAAHC